MSESRTTPHFPQGEPLPDQLPDKLFAAALRDHAAGRWADAETLYRRILAQQPRQPVVLHHLGLIAGQTATPDRAAHLIRHALALQPDYAEAYSNLGIVWRGIGDLQRAVICLERAIALRPGLAGAHNNLGAVYKELGRLDAAIPVFRAALSLQPEHPEIHCNLAAALLQQGEYDEGWREHEWRLHDSSIWATPQRFRQPRWAGESLAGRRLLLHAEQGLGDALQFARYAGPIAALGAKVIMEVPAGLTRLLATVPGVAQMVATGTDLPSFDYHLSLMSAPSLMRTTLATVPAEIPYVTPDARQVAAWRQRLAGLPGLKVGLVWAGDPRANDPRAHATDRQRSMTLAQFMPLLRAPGLSAVSLQMGRAADQLADVAAALRPFDAMADVNDFADSAAIIANLDLVISVDTSVAHLAGALGKPVWILSRFNGCWRWLHNRAESPWYPTARLFHQTVPGDWAEVVDRVAAALRRLVSDRSSKKKSSRRE